MDAVDAKERTDKACRARAEFYLRMILEDVAKACDERKYSITVESKEEFDPFVINRLKKLKYFVEIRSGTVDNVAIHSMTVAW
jgi:hypothetical protein